MSKNSTTRFITNFFVLVVSVALVGADLVVLAQNENDTTRGGAMTSQNGNTSGGNTSTGTRRRRRPRRRATANANTSSDMSGNVSAGAGDTSITAGAGMQANTNTGGTGRRRRRGRRRATTDMSGGAAATTTTTMGTTTGAADNTGGEQTDLSGTYTGTVNYPEGGLNGTATLTITGNNFTITPEGGGSAVSGRVTAVTTRKYTGVTMMFGDPTAPPPTQNPPPPPLPAVSLQAKRIGDRVTLTSVPGERRQFSFSSGAAAGTTGGTGRRRTRRRAKRTTGMGNMAHSNATM